VTPTLQLRHADQFLDIWCGLRIHQHDRGKRHTWGRSTQLLLARSSGSGTAYLFVPGQVPIATFQLFQINSNLTYTIGQQSVVASANSTYLLSRADHGLLQLFADTSASAALRQQTAALIANPKYAAWIATTKSAMGPQLSPFQSSLLDAAALVAANADLLGDPATLSPAQLARVPGFRTSLLSNAASFCSATGDALRADSATIPCNVTNSINANQAAAAATAPQSGSLYAQTMVLAQSPELASVESTIAAVATGAHSAALLAVPGFLLASFQSLRRLNDCSCRAPNSHRVLVSGRWNRWGCNCWGLCWICYRWPLRGNRWRRRWGRCWWYHLCGFNKNLRQGFWRRLSTVYNGFFVWK